MDLIDTAIQISTPERTLVSIDRLTIPDRQIMFLFGESGIGKSLMARSLFGLLDPDTYHGTVGGQEYARYREGEQAKRFRRHGFFVFQEPSSHLNPLMTILRQIREGGLASATHEPDVFQELWGDENRSRVKAILSVYPKPHRPSGGEKQRVLLAMAFKKIHIMETDPSGESGLFVFDEPTGSLDDALRNRFLAAFFKRFRRRPFTALFITHDYSIIRAVIELGAAIKDQITFRELAVSGESVFLRDFTPVTYSIWVASRRESQRHRHPENHTLVELQSGVRSVNRWLLISRDAGGEDECPLTVTRGRVTYLKGPSGIGKTTLVKSMLGLIPSRNLRLRMGDFTLSEHTHESYWRRHILGKFATMVFQHADEALNQRALVSEIFDGLPLKSKTRSSDMIRESLLLLFDESEVEQLLSTSRTIGTLSGGQKQRLNLLRAFVLDPECLILDEPLNGLDLHGTTRVLDLLDAKRDEGKGLLIISHNEDIFDTHADYRFYLRSRA